MIIPQKIGPKVVMRKCEEKEKGDPKMWPLNDCPQKNWPKNHCHGKLGGERKEGPKNLAFK